MRNFPVLYSLPKMGRYFLLLFTDMLSFILMVPQDVKHRTAVMVRG